MQRLAGLARQATAGFRLILEETLTLRVWPRPQRSELSGERMLSFDGVCASARDASAALGHGPRPCPLKSHLLLPALCTGPAVTDLVHVCREQLCALLTQRQWWARILSRVRPTRPRRHSLTTPQAWKSAPYVQSHCRACLRCEGETFSCEGTGSIDPRWAGRDGLALHPSLIHGDHRLAPRHAPSKQQIDEPEKACTCRVELDGLKEGKDIFHEDWCVLDDHQVV